MALATDNLEERARKALAMAEDAISTASMDMKDGPHVAYEIEAMLDGSGCLECGNPGWRRLLMGVGDHYTHCSRYDPR